MKTAIKNSSRKLKTTRLETWAMPGIPDVLVCDEQGGFHFVELKSTAGKAVDLSPHQVAWLSNHSHASVWVIVRKIKTKKQDEQIFIYHGKKAMDLKLEGLKTEPDLHFVKAYSWEDIFNLICPI